MRELANGRMATSQSRMSDATTKIGRNGRVRLQRAFQRRTGSWPISSPWKGRSVESHTKEQRAKALESLNLQFEAAASALTSTLSSAAANLKDSAETYVHDHSAGRPKVKHRQVCTLNKLPRMWRPWRVRPKSFRCQSTALTIRVVRVHPAIQQSKA